MQVPWQATSGLSDSWKALSPEMRGILLMCLSTACFAFMHTAIRYASTHTDVHTYQLIFFRNLFGLLIFVPVLATQGTAFLRTQRLGLHAFRSLLNVGAMTCFFFALAMTELAHVTALGFSAPIFAGVLSVLVLGERFRLRRWIAVGCGFVGMLVIVRPGFIPLGLGPLLVICSTLFWAIVLTIIKIMSRTESSLTIVAYMNIFLSVFSLGPALWVWSWPTWEGWALMVAIALFGTVAQLCVSSALHETDQTVIMPFDFLRLIWVAALGFVLFGEVPDRYIWIGGAIIFFSGVYMAYRERAARLNREAKGSPEGSPG